MWGSGGMSEHRPKSSGVNKFRDRWRQQIGECEHPDLTMARKLILLRLVDYTNSKDFTAWPSFDALADDLRLSRRTVIRAINTGRKVGLLKRTLKGGKTRRGGTSNRYIFDPRYDPDLVTGVTPGQDEQPSDRRDPT
jgi:Helix-turn-helix domain